MSGITGIGPNTGATTVASNGGDQTSGSDAASFEKIVQLLQQSAMNFGEMAGLNPVSQALGREISKSMQNSGPEDDPAAADFDQDDES